MGTESFHAAKEIADAAKHEAFMAQEPRQFSEPWGHPGPIVCGECGGLLFRDAGRSCYGHYQDYQCAACGGTESRLTETGMSF